MWFLMMKSISSSIASFQKLASWDLVASLNVIGTSSLLWKFRHNWTSWSFNQSIHENRPKRFLSPCSFTSPRQWWCWSNSSKVCSSTSWPTIVWSIYGTMVLVIISFGIGMYEYLFSYCISWLHNRMNCPNFILYYYTEPIGFAMKSIPYEDALNSPLTQLVWVSVLLQLPYVPKLWDNVSFVFFYTKYHIG